MVETVRFSASGDNLIHEGLYNQARARAADGGYDFTYAYENLRDFYAGFDVNWLNQETLVNDDYEPSGYPMFSTPGDITKRAVRRGVPGVQHLPTTTATTRAPAASLPRWPTGPPCRRMW